MTIPKVKHLYLYKGRKYVVRYCAMVDKDLVAQTYAEDEVKSEFNTFNYWDFLFHAKHLGEIKMSKAY